MGYTSKSHSTRINPLSTPYAHQIISLHLLRPGPVFVVLPLAQLSAIYDDDDDVAGITLDQLSSAYSHTLVFLATSPRRERRT